MGVKLRQLASGLPGAILLLCLAVIPSLAGEAGFLSIEQAWCSENEVVVFVNALDLQGSPLNAIDKDEIGCQLNQTNLPCRSIDKYGSNPEGIAWVVLIDVSRSLNENQFGDIKAAVNSLIQQMGARDRIALMSFGADVKVASDYSSNKEQLARALDSLAPVGDNTRLHEGLLQALEMSRRKDAELPLRRAVLLISDGCEDYTGGVSKDEVLANLKIGPVPVYALGIYNESVNSDAALESIGEVARASGGRAWQYQAGSLVQGVAVLLTQIRDTYVLRLDAANSPRDGKDYRLVIDLKRDGTVIQDGVSIYMIPTGEAPADNVAPSNTEPAWKGVESIKDIRGIDDLALLPLWIWAAVGGLVLLIICLIIILIVKRRGKVTSARQNASVHPGFASSENTSDYEAARLPDSSFDAETHYEPFPNFERSIKPDGIGLPGSNGWQDTFASPVISGDTGVAGLPSGYNGANSWADSGIERQRTVITLNVLGKERNSRTFEIVMSAARPLAFIGRTEGNDVVISGDDRVSARHCKLIYEQDKIYMQDLNSTNGTLVNGVPIIGRYALEANDLILVGKTELRYSVTRCDGGSEQ